MRNFSTFLATKDREDREHLRILNHIFEKAGFQVANHIDDQKEAYIFVRKPADVEPILETLSFEGIRIFTRGKELCFRAQNKENVEPWGSAYSLNIREMFKDLVHESHDKEKVGHLIIKFLIQEVKNFFVQSAQAEKEKQPPGIADDTKMGAAVVGASGTDYSNMVGKDYRP